MKKSNDSKLFVASMTALAALVIWGAGACASNDQVGAGASALEAAVVAAATSPGALLCTPTEAQTAACSGKAAGDACTFPGFDGGAGIAGTCRTTIDGAGVACAPTPPAPPQVLIDACAGKTAGAACSVAERGHTETGACALAPDGATLACRPVRTPPQAAVDACTGKAAGDACALPGRGADGGTAGPAGTCDLGPLGTGPLACEPPHGHMLDAAAACTGKAAGAACTLGGERRHPGVSGTCVTPSGASAAVCVIACNALGGSFGCGGPGGHGGGPGGGHGGGMGGGMGGGH